MAEAFTRTIKNQREEMPALLEDINSFLTPHQLDKKILNSLNLVLEEAMLNIIQHGEATAGSHDISVTLKLEADQVGVELLDNGRAFNPLALPHTRPNAAEVETQKAELGIHLVRNMMRSMAYRRENDKNIFEIWIKR
ncbi:MAG: ATP-binding protein [Desulfobacteraceae bacterium]|nr:ATP-binding protein [Desulfobacteraceae bacterium]